MHKVSNYGNHHILEAGVNRHVRRGTVPLKPAGTVAARLPPRLLVLAPLDKSARFVGC